MSADGQVVVTGLGAVTPFGWGAEALAAGLYEGRTAIRPLEALAELTTAEHSSHLAAEVPEASDDPLADLGACARARLSRADGFALAAAREALDGARLDVRGTDAGVFLGSNTGGMLEHERFHRDFHAGIERGRRVSRLTSMQVGSPAAALARVFGLEGPVSTLASACSAAGMAIEAALDSLRAGEVEVALAGGADGLCQLTFSGFHSLRSIAEVPCVPFRAGRTGLSLGEGAGVLVLETAAHARARGARPLAVLAGAGSSCDAHHMTAPDPTGAGLVRAMEKAFVDAGLRSEDVDFLNAHGTGTPLNDASEWRGLERVFGARARTLPVMATKGAVGHSLGACGGIEAVATLIALERECLPPAPGSGEVDPDCPVALSFGAPRAVPGCRTALSINLAFGGANAALVFQRAVEERAP